MPTDPALYALYQENQRLRELLMLVAQDLERLAALEPAFHHPPRCDSIPYRDKVLFTEEVAP